jgi:hypothetical protein
MLDPKNEPAALERLTAMAARESVAVRVLSELHTNFHCLSPTLFSFRSFSLGNHFEVSPVGRYPRERTDSLSRR